MYDPKKQLPIENKVSNTPDPHQLIATDRIIEMAKRLGISFGQGDPHERIRYFIKLGIIPNAVRKSAGVDKSITIGHLPYWTLKRLIVIDRLQRSGASFTQIAEKFKRIDNRRAKDQSVHNTQIKPASDSRSVIKNVLQSSVTLWANSGLSEDKIEEKLKRHKQEIDKKLNAHKAEIKKELGIINELTDTKDITKSLSESELNSITGYQNYLKKDPQPYEPDLKTLEILSDDFTSLEEKNSDPTLSVIPRSDSKSDHGNLSHRLPRQPLRYFLAMTPTTYHLLAVILIFFAILTFLNSPSVRQALSKADLERANIIASQTQENSEKLGAVLAASSEANKLYIDATTEFLGETTFIDPIIAPNVIYGLTGGTGIAVTAGQNPVVSLDSTEIVTTLNSTSGALTLAASGGTSISTSGSTITISSSSSSSGDITAVNAGNGLSGGASSGDASLAISLTSSGTSTTTTSASGLEFSSGLSLLRGCTNTQTLQWIAATATWDCATGGGGSFSSFTAAGDTGTNQTITDGNTLTIAGGTNGIDTVGTNTDIITLNVDTTEIGSTTFGSGSSVVWTFNTGTVDPTIDFNDGSVIFNEAGADVDYRIEGDNNANLFTLDAGLFSGVGQISLGAAAQGTATAFVVVDNPAITATSNQNFYKTYIDNNAAVTITGATTSSIVASLAIDEPNITATGTATNAVTLYVSGAPTEGSSGNFALWVDDGQSRFENTPVSGSTTGNAVTIVPTYVVEATDITLSGIRLALDGNSNADSGDVFYGFNADDFTTTSGPTEYGLRIGSGYDYQFYFELGTRDLRVSASAPSAGTSPLTATIPALAADDTFCFATLANCFGAGGGAGVTYTSQVTNALTKFTSTTGQITSSGITDDGSTLTLPANRSVTLTAGTGSITENFSPAGTTGTARALTITPTFGIDVTDQTLTGVYVNPNTNSNLDGGDVLNGVLIDTITASSATEYGLQIGSGYDQNIYFNDTTTNLLLADGGTITISDGTNTLCTLTDAGTTGNLSCTGNLTGGSGGTVGFWTRSSTFIYPSTTTDDLVVGDSTVAGASLFFDESAGTLSLGTDAVLNGSITLYSSGASETDPTIVAEADGDLTLSAATGIVNVGSGTGDITLDPGANNLLANLSSTGDFLIQDAGTAYVTFSDTGTTVFDFTGTTTVGVTVNANSLTSGTALALASTATAFNGELLTLSKTATTGSTAFTSDITNVTYSQTFNATVASASTGNVLDISRAYTVDDSTAGAISATISGAVVTISDNCTQGTADTCTHSGNVLSLTQSYASASGTTLAITNSGTGSAISSTSNTTSTGTANSLTANGISTGTVLDITTTGTITDAGEVINITANSLTSGEVIRLSATALSSGTAIEFTGPSATGITGNVISLTSDVGSAGELINLAPDFPGAGVTAYGVSMAATDSTTSTNTDYGYYTTLTLSGNAAKTGYGYYGLTTTSSTTADTLYGGYFSATRTAAAAGTTTGIYGLTTSTSTTADTLITLDLATTQSGASTSGTKNVYGLRNQPTTTGANTSTAVVNLYGNYLNPSTTLSTTATVNNYGEYIGGTATIASTGTVNRYGLYVANATMDATGTSTQYGIYVAAVSGADNNDALFTAGGVVQFTCTTHATTWAVSQANPSCSDYAEVYDSSDNSIEAGDLVSIDTLNQGKVGKSSGSYENRIIGVYSTSPGVLIGPQGIISAAGEAVKLEQGKIPVALTGRVPLKVSLENGPIKAGDPITSSSVPGVGMKATQPGRIIGLALEDFGSSSVILACPESDNRPENSIPRDSGVAEAPQNDNGLCQSKVMVFVNPNFYMPQTLADDLTNLISQTQTQTELLTQQAADLHALLAEDIQKAETLLAELESKNAETEEEITSLVKDEVNKQLISLGYVDYEATGSAQATSSALLAAQTNKTLTDLDNLLANSNLQLDTLKVLGLSSLAQTQVAGTLSQDGTFIIDYGKQINVLGSTLYLQNDSLAGNTNCHSGLLALSVIEGSRIDSGVADALQNDKCGVLLDIGSGKFSFDDQGNLVATGDIQAKGIVLSESISSSSIGSSQIPAGSSSVSIETSAVKPGAKILLTATGPTGGKSLYLADKQDYENFTVAIENGPATNNINFDWLIVNTTQVSSSE